MESWNEVRTAYQVARLGSVSAAAAELSLHRVTVIRHIEQLETQLGEKLFLRHAKGYAPTDAGYEMMRVAQAAEDQFEQLSARIKAQARLLAGELVVTSLPVVTQLIMPALKAFRAAHPDVVLRHISSARTLKLERGEAHVAIRSPMAEEQPDNVVQPFRRFEMGLFASRDYLKRRGAPKTLEDLADHDFVAPVEAAVPSAALKCLAALYDIAPAKNIVFRSTNIACVDRAIIDGLGIGLMPVALPKPDALELLQPRFDDVYAELNLVTHVDVHRTPRVQALLAALKAETAPDMS